MSGVAAAKGVDARVLNAFLEGTENVLKTMCSTEPVPGKPTLKRNRTASGDISGCIGLTGNGNGIVVLSFSKDAISTIVSRMLMETKTDIDNDVKDAVGELTNMVSGASRRILADHGISYEAGIPSVVVGPKHEIVTIVRSDAPTIMIPFNTDTGAPFSVEFTFDTV